MIWDDFLEYQDAKNKPIRHYFIKATKHTKYAALDVEGEVYVDNLFHDESLETVDPEPSGSVVTPSSDHATPASFSTKTLKRLSLIKRTSTCGRPLSLNMSLTMSSI